MKKLLATFVLTASLLTACNTPVQVEPVETETDETVWEEPALDNGDFTFDHNPIDSQYVIDVLYKGESVGSIEKEAPADGYNVYLMEEAGNKAFIAVNPTGLGGYILYGHAFEVYVYDFANQTFEALPVGGVDDISSDGNLVAYWTTWEGAAGDAGDTWGLAVYDLSKGEIVSNFSMTEGFFEGGHATFSPSGKNLAFELATHEGEDGAEKEEHALFLGAAVGGEFKEMDRQVNNYFSMDWEANEILKNFEAANQ